MLHIPTNYTLQQSLQLIRHSLYPEVYDAIMERVDSLYIDQNNLEAELASKEQEIEELEQVVEDQDKQISTLEDRIATLLTRLEEEGG